MRAEYDVLTVANQAAGCSFTLQLTGSLAVHTEQLARILKLRRGGQPKAPLISIGDAAESSPRHYRDDARIHPLFKLHSENDVHIFNLFPARAMPMKSFPLWQILHCLAFIISDDIIARGGVPLHCLLLANKGRGVVVAGRSGAGKTTLARNAPAPWQAMADDYAFIAATNSGYRVFPYPTISECMEKKAPRSCDIADSVPLTSLFFLDRAPKDEIVPIPAAEAVMGLYGAAATILQFYYRDFHSNPETKDAKKRLFDNVCAIGRGIPARRLKVSPKKLIWPMLQEVVDRA